MNKKKKKTDANQKFYLKVARWLGTKVNWLRNTNLVKSSKTLIDSLIFTLYKKPKQVNFNDGLNREVYAKRISEVIIKGHNGTENTVFAISGKWGAGKTQVLNFIEKYLKKERFTVVWFNAWQYSQEPISLKRAFLKTLSKQLKTLIDLSDLYNDLSSIKISYKNIFRLILFILILILVTSLFLFLKKNLNSFPQFEFKTYLLLFWNELSLFLKVLKEFVSNNIELSLFTSFLMFIFSELFTLKQSTSKITTLEGFKDKFDQILKNRKRVVVFIDDLDRCTPKVVKEVLDALTTFFKSENCSFVITGDHTVIEKYVGSQLQVEPVIEEGSENKIKTSLLKRSEGRRFLKKLFDIYWQLPTPEPALFKRFVEKEVEKSQIPNLKRNTTPILVDLMAGFLDKNPRAVIRFLASLKFNIETLQYIIDNKRVGLDSLDIDDKALVEIEIKNLEEVYENPALLSKILLIQELFYPMYEDLVQNPKTLIEHEKQSKNGAEMMTLTSSKGEVLFAQNSDKVMYAELLAHEPKFVNKNDDVIYSPENFLYLSGFTGLPSQKGPDESVFLSRCKLTGLSNKLIESLSITPEDKQKDYFKLIEKSYAGSTEIKEKQSMLVNMLEVMYKIKTWRVGYGFVLDQFETEENQPLLNNDTLTKIYSISFEDNLEIDRLISSSPPWDNLDTIFNVLKSYSGNVSFEIFTSLVEQLKTAYSADGVRAVSLTESVVGKADFSEEATVSLIEPVNIKLVESIYRDQDIARRVNEVKLLISLDPTMRVAETFKELTILAINEKELTTEVDFILQNQILLESYLKPEKMTQVYRAVFEEINTYPTADWSIIFNKLVSNEKLVSSNMNDFENSLISRLKSDNPDISNHTIEYLKNIEDKTTIFKQTFIEQLTNLVADTSIINKAEVLKLIDKSYWGSNLQLNETSTMAVKSLYSPRDKSEVSSEARSVLKSWNISLVNRTSYKSK